MACIPGLSLKGSRSLLALLLLVMQVLLEQRDSSSLVEGSKLENGILLGFILAKKAPRFL